MSARYPETFCSQCGGAFGPGDSGYSHCRDHTLSDRLPVRIDGVQVETSRERLADLQSAGQRPKMTAADLGLVSVNPTNHEMVAALRASVRR